MVAVRLYLRRREALHSPEDGDVVDLDTLLEQQLLDIAVRQVVPQADAARFCRRAPGDTLERALQSANATAPW